MENDDRTMNIEIGKEQETPSILLVHPHAIHLLIYTIYNHIIIHIQSTISYPITVITWGMFDQLVALWILYCSVVSLNCSIAVICPMDNIKLSNILGLHFVIMSTWSLTTASYLTRNAERNVSQLFNYWFLSLRYEPTV